ncbi:XdhC/CoxI family protein [Xanthomonas campestris pv. plantaginis]
MAAGADGLQRVRAGGAPANTSFQVSEGHAMHVIRAAVQAIRGGGAASLAVVLETEGSTYSRSGSLALFSDADHVGWISGGCLEPEIQRRAVSAFSSGMIEWLEIDTRDDTALFSGAAVGCRGRQRIALLPLPAMTGLVDVLASWLSGYQDLQLEIGADGSVRAATQRVQKQWRMPTSPLPWAQAEHRWEYFIYRPPELLVLGAGPEAKILIPLLETLGWQVTLVERRARWRDTAVAKTGHCLDVSVAEALSGRPPPDAALVMHHNFEMDRDALEALAGKAVAFVGLLGPERRSHDLFKLLSPDDCALLRPRLRSPVGLHLGGRGPEAIALSIAAQLQAWRHSISI